MNDETTVKISRRMVQIASQLGEQFGATQKQVIEQAVDELFERYKDQPHLTLTRLNVRESKGHYGSEPKKDKG